MSRCTTLHDTAAGYLFECKQEEILREIDGLAHTDPEDIPELRCYLLEVNFTALQRSPIDKQSYRLLSMKSAIRAGRRRLLRQCRRISSGQHRASGRERDHPLPRRDSFPGRALTLRRNSVQRQGGREKYFPVVSVRNAA